MKPDLSNWYTEGEAADAIECSVRNVQRYIAAGKIEVRKRAREGKKPENVLNPRDVDALRPAAHVMSANEPEAKVSFDPTSAPPARRNGPASADAFFSFLSTITTAVAARQDVAIGSAPAWVTIDEAAGLSGLTTEYIRRQIREQKIVAVYGGPHGALRVHRGALEEFRG